MLWLHTSMININIPILRYNNFSPLGVLIFQKCKTKQSTHTNANVTFKCIYIFPVYYYTSRFLTSYVGLTQRNTEVATTSESTIEGTMRLLCSYWMHSNLCHRSIIYSHKTLKDTLTCSSHSGTAYYETYIADWKPGGGVLDFGLDGGVPPRPRDPNPCLEVKKGTHV